MGHSWSDAGLRAHKQWKKNQQWQGTSQHHQQEVKPSRSSWILKENKDYPSHSAKGREPDKKRSLEPPKPKSPESQQKLSGLEKTKDKAKVAEKPKPAAEKRAAKAADDELSSEYEYVTETESSPEMAVPKKPKPPSKARATSSAAPKASAPKAPGPVAPTASGPSAGPNGLSAVADFYQSQANFLRTVGRHWGKRLALCLQAVCRSAGMTTGWRPNRKTSCWPTATLFGETSSKCIVQTWPQMVGSEIRLKEWS